MHNYFSFSKNVFFCIAVYSLILVGCRDDATRTGCTDYKASNFNSLATEDDRSCTYLDSIQQILANGEPGHWGTYSHSGGVDFNACFGEIGTVIFSVDSANGENKALYFKKDIEGKMGVSGVVVNPVSGAAFKHGYLTFKAMLPKNSKAKVLDLHISGPFCKNISNTCQNECISNPLQISVQTLSDTSFQQIVIPIFDFKGAKINPMSNVFSLYDSVSGGNDTLIYIKDINWRTYYNMNQGDM